MKKLFFLSAMVALLAGTASALEIYSCNTVGVQRVTGVTTESKVTVPMPFEAIGGGAATLQDSLYIGNTTLGTTVQLCLNSTSGYYLQWMSLNGYSDSFFPVSRTEGGQTINPPVASEQLLPQGTGLIVELTDPEMPVYVMGQYSSVVSSTTVTSGTHSYLCNPLVEAIDLDRDFTTNVEDGDFIIVKNNGAETLYYFNKTGSNGKYWYKEVKQLTVTTFMGQTRAGYTTTKTYDSPTIAAGDGFWFYRVAATDFTFTWGK